MNLKRYFPSFSTVIVDKFDLELRELRPLPFTRMASAPLEMKVDIRTWV